MAECMDFLDKYFDVYSDMFDGFAYEVAVELLEDRGINRYSEEGEKLIGRFMYDFLIEDLFVAMQDAFNSLTPSNYWGRWNEKFDEMIGESK